MKRIVLSLLLLWAGPVLAQQGVKIQVPTGQGNSYQTTAPTTPLPITGVTNIPTYAAANASIANTGAGDVFCIQGSSVKTVKVKRFRVSAIANSAIVVDTILYKRSAIDTGGTPLTETAVPLDSLNAAASALVKSYSASPLTGTTVGPIRARHIAAGTQGNTATVTEALYDFASYYDQPLVLRGATQAACVNVGALGTGGNWAIDVEWTEE